VRVRPWRGLELERRLRRKQAKASAGTTAGGSNGIGSASIGSNPAGAGAGGSGTRGSGAGGSSPGSTLAADASVQSASAVRPASTSALGFKGLGGWLPVGVGGAAAAVGAALLRLRRLV
jgi:hypothetical protein